LGPPLLDMTTYHHMFPDTRNKKMYGLGMGISTDFKILQHLRIKWDITFSYGHDMHTMNCSLTQGTIIYDLWVKGFKIFEHHGLRGTGPLRIIMTYTPSNATWQETWICNYGLGVGISTVFEILWYFLSLERTKMNGHDLQIIRCSWYNRQEYIWFSRYLIGHFLFQRNGTTT
jgi:hypothetical protein